MKGGCAMSVVMSNQTFPTIINNTLSLLDLAREAVGARFRYNISPSIPFQALKHTKGCGGITYPELAQCAFWEIGKKAAQRLVNAGYFLGNIAELAQFTAQYPKETEKYPAVFALEEGSRWLNSGGDVCVSFANIEGLKRSFRSYRFDRLLDPEDRVLVFRQVGHRFLTLPPAVL